MTAACRVSREMLGNVLCTLKVILLAASLRWRTSIEFAFSDKLRMKFSQAGQRESIQKVYKHCS